MLIYLKCNKCNRRTCIPTNKSLNDMVCGAVVQYIFADDSDVGENGPIKSLGMKPIGCGGKMIKISEEEAMSYD